MNVKEIIKYYYLDITTEEENRLVRDILFSMNPRYHKLLRLKYDVGMTWPEISRTLHTPVRTLRHWHDRALTIVQEEIEEYITAHC